MTKKKLGLGLSPLELDYAEQLDEIGKILVKLGMLTKDELERDGVRMALRNRYVKGKKPRKTAPKPADIEITRRKGLTRFSPLTRAGRDWLEENVHADVVWRFGDAGFDLGGEQGRAVVRAAMNASEIRVRKA